MATEPTPQRAYRAACPNCGAPVEFRSAASAYAVCSFCKSTVVREGDALRKIGQSAELFDDHSPLRLGAGGSYQGVRFTLVGRLQYRYDEGTWNEWHALFDTGHSGWLSEDNGRYVIAFDVPMGSAPAPATLLAGAPMTLAGQPWSVASVSRVSLLAAEGELPYRPPAAHDFTVADLRNTRGEVGTLDYGDQGAPRWSIGRSVAIGELAMTGLSEAGERSLNGRAFECPNCGAPLQVELASTQSIVCRQCHSVVDVSQGVGAELQHYRQVNGTPPLIPLGSTGTLRLGRTELPWQVVGYVERCEVPGDGDSDSEQSFWREYLLYHRTEGFAFIVDAQDGWSWTVPITGVPEGAGSGVKLDGVVYRKLYDYTGMVTYVLGEFYWRVTQNQRTYNSDYQGTGAAGARRLNREQTQSGDAQEVVWSGGETLLADSVFTAFRLAAETRGSLQRDALPTSLHGGSLLAKILLWAVILFVVFLVFRCSTGTGRCDALRSNFGAASAEYQNCLNSSRSGAVYGTSGGAFGGFSTGGGHK